MCGISGFVTADRRPPEERLGEVRKLGRWSARLRAVLLATALVALLVGILIWGAKEVGVWLVVEDPLARARAVVTLGGHLPFRAMEAASIYRQGWAPEAWVTRPAPGAEQAALHRLGIQVPSEEVYTRQVLERLGVPATAIYVLSQPAEKTAQGAQVIAQELQQVGGRQVILVTSKPHTRRVRATWRALIGESPHAVIRYATVDPYNADRWWHRSGDALAVSREVLGLLNVWAGFPVGPDQR